MKSSDRVRQKIRDLREDKHLTQADMAEKLNLSLTGYAKIERGETLANIDRLTQIAEVLGVSIADLVDFGDESIVIVNKSYDSSNNSSHFNIRASNTELEMQIQHLQELLQAKNEIISKNESEIEYLKQQLNVLNTLVLKK